PRAREERGAEGEGAPGPDRGGGGQGTGAQGRRGCAEKEEEGSRGVGRRRASEARQPQGGRRFSARPPARQDRSQDGLSPARVQLYRTRAGGHFRPRSRVRVNTKAQPAEYHTMTHTIPSRFAHASRAVVRACAAVAVLVATSVGGANAAEVLFRSNPASLPDTVTSFHGSVPPAPPLTQPTQPPGTPDVPVTPAELARAADSLAGLRKASRGVDYLWVLRDQLI